MKRNARTIRCYELALHPNPGKAEQARYTLWWAERFCLDYVRRLFDAPPNTAESTASLGQLPNQQQKRARDILRAGRAAEKETGIPFNCPKQVTPIVDARISEAKGTTFQYWIRPIRGAQIPAKTHRGLTRALKMGGKLRPYCEVRAGRNGGLVARVFVEYEKVKPTPSRDFIGCDVGVNHGVSTSDGRVSKSLRGIMDKAKFRKAERQRQGHPTASPRSSVKQELDREARRIVTLAAYAGKSIAIERLKTLGNLKVRGKIGSWARVHFGERVRQIAELFGVTVVEVHPAYTSQCCPKCDCIDKRNRRGIEFRCVACGFTAHADVNGARNIARKARGDWDWTSRKGRVINTIRKAELLPPPLDLVTAVRTGNEILEGGCFPVI